MHSLEPRVSNPLLGWGIAEKTNSATHSGVPHSHRMVPFFELLVSSTLWYSFFLILFLFYTQLLATATFGCRVASARKMWLNQGLVFVSEL